MAKKKESVPDGVRVVTCENGELVTQYVNNVEKLGLTYTFQFVPEPSAEVVERVERELRAGNLGGMAWICDGLAFYQKKR